MRERVVFILTFAIVVSVAWAEDIPGIPPDKLKQAEATYADVFGMSHEKLLKTGKPAEKAEFAKKLFDRAKESKADAALQEILQRNSLLFAQPDPAGFAIAQEIYRSHLAVPERKAAALEKLGEWHERSVAFVLPANRAKASADAIKFYRDAASEWEKSGFAASAMTANTKARAAIRKFTPTSRDLLASIDADDKRLQPLAGDQIELEKLKAIVEKMPDDAKARLALGIAYLKMNSVAAATAQFNSTQQAAWMDLALTMSGDPATCATTAAKAAATLPPDDKKSRYTVLEFARVRLEEARTAGPAKWPELRTDYLAILEQLSTLDPPSQSGKHATILVVALLDFADEQAARREFAKALATIVQARAASKLLKPADSRELLGELDTSEKWLKSRATLEAEVAKLTEADRVAPLDAKANLVLGVALLRLGQLGEAAPKLSRADGKPWQALAKTLALGDAAPPLEIADLLRVAAADLKGDEKLDLQSLAREKYEVYLATAPKNAADRPRVALLAKELPASNPGRLPVGAVIDLFENAAVISKAFRDATVDGKVEVSVVGGHVLIATRGNDSQAFLPKDRVVTIVENPTKPGEYRYCGFWIRKDGRGTDYSFQLRQSAQPEVRYGLQPAKVTSEAIHIRIANQPSDQWQFVVRDVFADFGGPTKIVNAAIGNRDPDGTTWVSHLYFSNSLATIQKVAARRKPPK